MGKVNGLPEMGPDGTAGPYRYDAFISYRHVEPDRSWAKWLHESLETYRVPQKLARQGVAPRVRRVFRDEEELSASADLRKEILARLAESRFLIVVCSPRTPQSKWVNAEVQRFRDMGRHDRILALLVEGDPSEAFPAALREIRTTIADERGGPARRSTKSSLWQPMSVPGRVKPHVISNAWRSCGCFRACWGFALMICAGASRNGTCGERSSPAPGSRCCCAS